MSTPFSRMPVSCTSHQDAAGFVWHAVKMAKWFKSGPELKLPAIVDLGDGLFALSFANSPASLTDNATPDELCHLVVGAMFDLLHREYGHWENFQLAFGSRWVEIQLGRWSWRECYENHPCLASLMLDVVLNTARHATMDRDEEVPNDPLAFDQPEHVPNTWPTPCAHDTFTRAHGARHGARQDADFRPAKRGQSGFKPASSEPTAAPVRLSKPPDTGS